VEFSSNLSAIYTKWCAQTFPPIFGLFAILDRNFATIIAPASDEYENCVVHLKESNPFWKRFKPRLNRDINGNAMLVELFTPRQHRCSGLGAWPTKNTIFSHLQSARVVRSSPNFAWW